MRSNPAMRWKFNAFHKVGLCGLVKIVVTIRQETLPKQTFRIEAPLIAYLNGQWVKRSVVPRPQHPLGLIAKLHEAWFLSLKIYSLSNGYCGNGVISFWSTGPFHGAAVTAPFRNDKWSKKQSQSVEGGADDYSSCSSSVGDQAIKNPKARKTIKRR